MIRKISLDNRHDIEKWDNFVNSHPKATPFHHSSWLKIINEAYSFRSLLYIQERNGLTVGIAPLFIVRGFSLGKRMVSIPFSDYGGPLHLEEKDEDDLLDFLRNKEHHKSIEMRSSLRQNRIFVNRTAYKRHRLNLCDETQNSLYQTFNKRTVQYSIRKALRNGVQIIEDNSSEGMEEFCRLNSMTRKKNGVPCQPKKFFEKIYQELIISGSSFLLFATYESKRVASGLFLKFGKSIYYKYNASDPEYLSKVTPNHLLMWSAIEKARTEDFKIFDLGRTSSFDQGLLRHKRMWSAEETDLSYSYFPKVRGATSKEGDSNCYEISTRIWKLLPNVISDKIGPMLFVYFA